MKVTFPKIPATPELEKFLQTLLYRKVDELKEWTTYEGVFEFGIARQNLRLSARDFVSFTRATEVDGGYKRQRGDMLLVQPFRTKPLVVRISEDYLCCLEKVAKALGRRPSEHARISLLHALQKALESFGWPEHEIKKSGWKGSPLFGASQPIGKKRLPIRISNEQYNLLEKVSEADGQTISQYVRMVLENVLPKELTVLGLAEPQTSEGATRG